jgi:hypothetical protein
MTPPRTRRLFPDTYRTIERAYAEGIPAAQVWFVMREAIASNKAYRFPAERAAALAVYYEYLVEIYGEDATRGLHELGRPAIGGKPS